LTLRLVRVQYSPDMLETLYTSAKFYFDVGQYPEVAA
jgi:hypothetical protein